MAIYAVMLVFAAIIGMFAAIIAWFAGTGAAFALLGIWAAIGIIVAAPVIVDRGKPKKADDLFRYLGAAVIVGPFMMLDIMKFYGND